MKKKVAKQLNKHIQSGLSESSSYQCLESRTSGQLTKFHTFADGKPCLGAYLIENENHERLWFLVIDWRRNENFYVSVYPEKTHNGVLAELHNDVDTGEQSELQWRYSPSKRDGKNQLRKEAFETLCGSLELSVSLPGADLTVEEFFDDVFALVDARLTADKLPDNPRVLKPRIYTEGRRVWKQHLKIERSSKAAKEAKEMYRTAHSGRCPCELCKFDFSEKYGTIGEGFIEAHHKEPLHKLKSGQLRNTQASDFLMLCANCHRMVHRSSFGGNLNKVRAVLAEEI